MKKTIVGIAVSLLVIGLFVVVVKSGTAKSQTSSPTSSSTTSSTPSTPTPSTNTPSTSSAPTATATASVGYKNRPLARWEVTNMVFLTTLINDTNKALAYLEGMNMPYAEVALPQLSCDIDVLKGRNSPSQSSMNSRALGPVPSGYKCPPIPDAQSAADLNVGMAQLESAIVHITNGENSSNGDLTQLGEAEMKAASKTFEKVITDLGTAAQLQIP